jgi:hypothetical protein
MGFLIALLPHLDQGLHDTDAKIHKIQIEGDRSILDIENYVRARYHVPIGNKVIIQRQDGQPFWIENRTHYTIVTQYDPDLETMPSVNVRIDATNRSYLLKDIRIDGDPTHLMTTLSAKVGF